MKAISLWQPWASAIALGHKKIETRSWSSWYLGPLAIHAAKTFPKVAKEFAQSERALGRCPARLPFGAIVAVCRLIRCEYTVNVVSHISAVERLYGDYSAGRFAWILEDIRPLEDPIPWKGMQGLFDVPDEVLKA